jgi:hypothetical protein
LQLERGGQPGEPAADDADPYRVWKTRDSSARVDTAAARLHAPQAESAKRGTARKQKLPARKFHALLPLVAFVVLFPAKANAVRLDAELFDTHGAHIRLATLRDRPTLVFFEDRHSTELNKPLKDALLPWAKSHDALSAIHLVAIANLRAFNFFPAKQFALSAVRETEKKVGIPLWIDFTGAVTGALPVIPADSSTVLVLDRDGTVIWQKSGRLADEDTRALFALLESLL